MDPTEECVADLQGPILDEQSCNRPAPPAQFSLDNGAARLTVVVCLEFHYLCLEQYHLKQVRYAHPFLRRDFDKDIMAAPLFRNNAVFRELASYLLGIGIWLVDLLTATTIGTLAALAWLIASTVCGMTPSSAATTRTTMSVTFCPSGPHRRKRLMTRGVEENDILIVEVDLISTYMLGYPACLGLGHLRLAYSIKE